MPTTALLFRNEITPTLDDNRVYTVSREGHLVWQTGNDPAAYSSPVPYTWNNERCVVVFHAPSIVGYRVKDGQELWRHPWKTSYDVNAATPVVEGDKAGAEPAFLIGTENLQNGAGPEPKPKLANSARELPPGSLLRLHQ